MNRTTAISDFLEPQPPAGSGLHRYVANAVWLAGELTLNICRYVFLLFKESPGFKHQKLVTSSSSRFHFNLSAFAEATGLGEPLGGTLFRAGVNLTT